ncbi:hypothetical protein [Methanoculleus sp. 10]|uniref:hypothetical protein n=1 Tax=Methanoculleus sp. 10 TaxID=430615 RepID=UPI0025E1DB24|nr:hypothetical protein [Methanoculleus sp. 10]
MPPAGYHTLDGLAYLDATRPGEAAAIDYLRTLGGSHRIVEAENGDYGYYSGSRLSPASPRSSGRSATGFDLARERRVVRGSPGGYPRDLRGPGETLALMAKLTRPSSTSASPERERYDVRLPEHGLVLIYEGDGVRIYAPEA